MVAPTTCADAYSFTQAASVMPTRPLLSAAVYACLTLSLNANAVAPDTNMTAAMIATFRLSGGIFALSRHALFPACDHALCAVDSLALVCCCVHCRQTQDVRWRVTEERADNTLRDATVVIASFNPASEPGTETSR